jgi:carboxypeptidase Taq
VNNVEKLSRLQTLLEEMNAYMRSIGKLSFDMSCCAPEEGLEKAGEDMAVLGKQLFALMHAPEYEQLVTELYADSEGLTPVQTKMVEHLYDSYLKTKNFTPEFSYEMDLTLNKAYGAWLAAKKASDFSLFRDNLAAVVDVTRRAVALRDRQYPTPYTALSG